MRAYETTYIQRADVSDDAQKSFLEKVKGIIQAHEGQVIAVEDWGKRKLAYAIGKETRGYYAYILYTGNNELVAEIERNLRLNEQILRFLSVTVTDEYDVKTFKRKPTMNVAQPAAVPAVHAAAPAAE